MYKLTDTRLEKARAILERYRAQLLAKGRFDAGLFEQELRKCWDIGYQTLKGVAIDMAKKARYKKVALYYMEHINGAEVVCEFQGPLAKAYGVRSYHAPNLKMKRAQFWAALKARAAGKDVR